MNRSRSRHCQVSVADTNRAQFVARINTHIATKLQIATRYRQRFTAYKAINVAIKNDRTTGVKRDVALNDGRIITVAITLPGGGINVVVECRVTRDGNRRCVGGATNPTVKCRITCHS